MINMPEEEDEIKDGIKDHILKLAYDSNGNHVLQKVLLVVSEENCEFIYEPILGNFADLCLD